MRVNSILLGLAELSFASATYEHHKAPPRNASYAHSLSYSRYSTSSSKALLKNATSYETAPAPQPQSPTIPKTSKLSSKPAPTSGSSSVHSKSSASAGLSSGPGPVYTRSSSPPLVKNGTSTVYIKPSVPKSQSQPLPKSGTSIAYSSPTPRYPVKNETSTSYITPTSRFTIKNETSTIPGKQTSQPPILTKTSSIYIKPSSSPPPRSETSPIHSKPHHHGSNVTEYVEKTAYVYDTVTATQWKTYCVENTTIVTIKKPSAISLTLNNTIYKPPTAGAKTSTKEYPLPADNSKPAHAAPFWTNKTITAVIETTATRTVPVTTTVTVCPPKPTFSSSSSTCVSSCVVDITATLLQYPSQVAEAPFYYPNMVVDAYVEDGTTSFSTVTHLESTSFPALTWTMSQFPGVTFTYPTTYIAYTQFEYSFTRTTTQAACHTKADSLALQQPTYWPSLIYPTQSIATPSVPPSTLVSYLNSLPTVTAQLEGQYIGQACDPGKGSTSSVNTPAPITVTYTRATATVSTRSVIPLSELVTEAPAPTTTSIPPPPPPPPPPSTTTVPPPPPPPSTTTIPPPPPSIPPPPPPPSTTTTLVLITANAGATAGALGKAGAFVIGAIGVLGIL